MEIFSKIGGLLAFLIPGVRQSTVELMVYYFGILFLICFRKVILTVIGNPGYAFRNLPKLAIREEAMFRWGSEKWSFLDRMRSCFSFGLIHFTMMIVPIGVCFLLAVGGMVFMGVYLASYRTTGSAKIATEEAATVHTTYNLMVAVTAVVTIIATLVWEVYLVRSI